MENVQNYGFVSGDVCNRNKCKGVIAEHDTDQGCSCHINPPCSKCTEDRHFCPECDWHSKDDYVENLNGYVCQVDSKTRNFNSWEPRKLDPTKIDYRVSSHTNSSQICEGVYPKGTTQAQILERVKGTFGGRFEHFGNGKFKYIAYTD
jgi:hypothetical protein